jgi:hypothetical protein
LRKIKISRPSISIAYEKLGRMDWTSSHVRWIIGDTLPRQIWRHMWSQVDADKRPMKSSVMFL